MVAQVREYCCTPVQCSNTGLWCVPDASKQTTVTVPIARLSRPLVVAKNGNELWILD